MRSLTIALSAALSIAMSVQADAAEYNKRPFLDAGSQARVMNAIARSQALKGKDFDEDSERRCGVERDGVIVDRQPGNQKTIIVTEDIFNFGGTTTIESDCRR